MIERQHLVEEHQASIGHSKLILRQRRQPLDLADDIVGKESHRARRERRQPRQPRRSVPAQRSLQLGENIALEAAPTSALLHRNRRAPRHNLLVRLDPDERITPNVFAALDRLQQKRLRLGCPLGRCATRRNAETGVSRSAVSVRYTGTSVCWRLNLTNSRAEGRAWADAGGMVVAPSYLEPRT